MDEAHIEVLLRAKVVDVATQEKASKGLIVHTKSRHDRTLRRAGIGIRKRSYRAFDFLQRYAEGFECAIVLDKAPKLGLRETRRIKGRYVLTEADLHGRETSASTRRL